MCGPVARRSFEHDKEQKCSIKAEAELLLAFKKGSAPCSYLLRNREQAAVGFVTVTVTCVSQYGAPYNATCKDGTNG